MRTGGTINERGSLDLIWPERHEMPKALLRVTVQSKDAQTQHVDTGWALLYIAHYDSVLVLNRRIKQDEHVLDTDLSIIWSETTRFHGNPLTPRYYKALASAGTVYANRYIAENRTLKKNDLRNAFDVVTGQQVIMTYIRNGITLELTCKSRNKGFKGDIVKLFSPDTQHMYKARISGPQKADWVETLE